MKILLVRPGRRKQAITLGEFMFAEPIGLECVAALLKDEHTMRILDLMVGEEDFRQVCQSWQPSAIGFTSLCVDVLAVLELAAEAKRILPEVVTIVGGTQTFLAPESFFSPAIDFIAEYTTRENLPQLFACLATSQPVPPMDGIRSRLSGFQGTGAAGHNSWILPHRLATEKYRQAYSYFGYRPCALLQTSLGCSGRCNFCLRWKIEGSQEIDRPLGNVIAEIKSIAEPSIMIIDNDFLYCQERMVEFCDCLERERIVKNFICYGSARSILQNGPQVMARLAVHGLRAVLIGYESFRDEDLADYQKSATTAINRQAAEILKSASIDCWASFILHPDWDSADFRQFRKYIRQLQPQISSLNPLTPFPGSYLARKYKDRMIFAKEDYDQWSYSLVSIRPSRMSLRRYYWQVLISNLYVNLLMNNAAYLIRKFGYRTLWRLTKGSLSFFLRYTRLMVKG